MDSPSIGDDVLVALSQDGDTLAFSRLVRRYAPFMRACAARFGPGPDEIDDIVQESLITAWQRLSQLEDGGAVRSWLLRITAHKAIDAARRYRPHSGIDKVQNAASAKATPASQVFASEGQRALAKALDELPRGQQEVWRLREFVGMSYEEIAHTLGISATAVRGRLARARQTLVEEMEEWR